MLHTVKCRVNGLDDSDRVEVFRSLIKERPEILRVDVNAERSLARLISSQPIELAELQRWLISRGLEVAITPLPLVPKTKSMKACLDLVIDGMSCHSCEVLIEHAWQEIPGVQKVSVRSRDGAARIHYEAGSPPALNLLDAKIRPHGYRLRPENVSESSNDLDQRLSLGQLLGFALLVLLIGKILSEVGVLKPTVALETSLTIGAAFLLGLLAASSSCVAVSGGLLLSIVGRVRQWRPVLLFVAGRIAAYTFFGAMIGLIGSALLLPPAVMGLLTVLAALIMLIMGLDSLRLLPVRVKSLLPRPPKMISKAVFGWQQKNHFFTPLMLGGSTFFLPCGFTQALQLYALTTGNPATSALLLGAFALGTSPALLALGWASGSLRGRAGQFFFRFSAVAVVILGLWNFQNGLTIMGYQIGWPDIEIVRGSSSLDRADSVAVDPNVRLKDGVQIIQMSLSSTHPYYSPSNTFTVAVGQPVRLEISGQGTGCRAFFQIPKLGVRAELDEPLNIIAFTPQKAGTYSFSCSMGMFRGEFKVVESENNA